MRHECTVLLRDKFQLEQCVRCVCVCVCVCVCGGWWVVGSGVVEGWTGVAGGGGHNMALHSLGSKCAHASLKSHLSFPTACSLSSSSSWRRYLAVQVGMGPDENKKALATAERKAIEKVGGVAGVRALGWVDLVGDALETAGVR